MINSVNIPLEKGLGFPRGLWNLLGYIKAVCNSKQLKASLKGMGAF